MPDDQFKLDAERYAELVALRTVLLGQFFAVESELGWRLGPAVALVVGEPGAVLALVVGGVRSAVAIW